MKNPHVAPHGLTCECAAIDNWLENDDIFPITYQRIFQKQFIASYSLQPALNPQNFTYK